MQWCLSFIALLLVQCNAVLLVNSATTVRGFVCYPDSIKPGMKHSDVVEYARAGRGKQRLFPVRVS